MYWYWPYTIENWIGNFFILLEHFNTIALINFAIICRFCCLMVIYKLDWFHGMLTFIKLSNVKIGPFFFCYQFLKRPFLFLMECTPEEGCRIDWLKRNINPKNGFSCLNCWSNYDFSQNCRFLMTYQPIWGYFMSGD